MPAKGSTRSATPAPNPDDAVTHTHDDAATCTSDCPAYRYTEAHKAAGVPEPGTDAAHEARLWADLVAPFPADWVEKLPKVLRRDDQDKGRCEVGSRYTADGHVCHGWHCRAVHLDYIGHAGITDRLNTVLGPGGWDFQPYAETPDGWPAMGSLFYAKLTILGVTKWDLAANFSGPQEAYGDALRRCAMRFGIGTYLWSKSEQALAKAQGLDPAPVEEPQVGQRPTQAEVTMTAAQARLRGVLNELDADQATALQTWWGEAGLPGIYDLSDEHVATVEGQVRGMLTPDPTEAR